MDGGHMPLSAAGLLHSLGFAPTQLSWSTLHSVPAFPRLLTTSRGPHLNLRTKVKEPLKTTTQSHAQRVMQWFLLT